MNAHASSLLDGGRAPTLLPLPPSRLPRMIDLTERAMARPLPANAATPKAPRFVLMASVCVVVAALYFAQDVLIPLALATLLTFLLSPLVQRLERWRLHRVPSVIIVAVLTFGAL